MKDNKLIKGIMIAAVVLIWGVIIYRIVGMVFPDEPVNALTVTGPKREVKATAVSSFALAANYRDPFFGKMFLPVEKKENPRPVKKGPPREEIDWSFVKYFGVIRNNTSKKNVAMVNINGKDYMVLEGDVVEGFKFVKNPLDSVKITCKGRSCWVSKN